MALKLGTLTPTALYLGTTAASAAYLGATQVYSTGGADAYAIGGASPELVAAFLTAADGTTEGEYFRTGGSVDDFSMFTFSRSGTATYFDSNGTLQTAADGVARRNAYYYNGSAWAKGGLQLESAAATNLLSYSNDFSNASWVKDSVTVAQDATGIDGGTSAFTLTATGSLAYVRQTVTTAATGHTFSIFVKAGTATVFWIYYRIGATEGVAYFDLSDESTQAVAGLSQTPTNLNIEKVGDFYRISANWVPTASSYAWGVGISDAKGSTAVTSGKTGIICASQLEAGSIPTSYIPTTGSTVTRAAETLSIAGADTPANTTAMSISMKGLMTYADRNDVVDLQLLEWRVSGNYIEWFLSTLSAKTGNPWARQDSGVPLASTNYNLTDVYSPGVNVPFSVATRHTTDDIQLAAEGTAFAEGTNAGSLPDLSAVPVLLFDNANGFISEFRMWGTDIGDSGIAEVTS